MQTQVHWVATGGATTSPPPLAGEGQGGGIQHRSQFACPLPTPPPQAGEGAGRARGTAVPSRMRRDRCVHAFTLRRGRTEFALDERSVIRRFGLRLRLARPTPVVIAPKL